MKKVLVTLALLLAFGGLSAQNNYEYKVIKTFTNQLTAWDTVFQMRENWAWMLQLKATKNDDSTSFAVYVSSGDTAGYAASGLGFVLYPGLDTVHYTSATFTGSFDDPD